MFTITENYRLFDIFTIKSLQGFTYNFDGPVGKRVLFMENKDNGMLISFEEGAGCLDMKPMVSFSCKEAELISEAGFIHQRRIAELPHFAYFHFEYPVSDRKALMLSGQLMAEEGYTWSADGVEPILEKLLNSISPVE